MAPKQESCQTVAPDDIRSLLSAVAQSVAGKQNDQSWLPQIYTQAMMGPHCGLQHTLGLNSSAQTIIAYSLILGRRANVSVELALPKEAGKRNGKD